MDRHGHKTSPATRFLYTNTGLGLTLGGVGLLRLWFLFALHPSVTGTEAALWSAGNALLAGQASETPSLVAVLLAILTTWVGPDVVWLRVPGVVAGLGAAWGVWRLGRLLFDARVSFWGALIFATLPVVTYTSLLTDQALFASLFWAVALIALLRALKTDRRVWWGALGTTLGLGTLTAWSVALLVPCFLLYAAISPEYHRLGRRSGPWLAVGLATLILGSAFLVFGLSGANVPSPTPLSVVSFLVAQIGAFGPVVLGIVLWIVFHPEGGSVPGVADAPGERWRKSYRVRFFLSFSLPVLGLLAALAGLGQKVPFTAALPAGIGCAVLVADWLVRTVTRRVVLWGLVGCHLAVGLAFLAPGDGVARRVALRAADNQDPFVGETVASDATRWLVVLGQRYPDAPVVFEDPALRSVLSFHANTLLGDGVQGTDVSDLAPGTIVVGVESMTAPIALRYPLAHEVGFAVFEGDGGSWLVLRALQTPATP